MKRLLFCLFLVAVLILPGAFCQAAPAIDGYQQLKWGAPENAVQAFAAASGWVADSVEKATARGFCFMKAPMKAISPSSLASYTTADSTSSASCTPVNSVVRWPTGRS